MKYLIYSLSAVFLVIGVVNLIKIFEYSNYPNPQSLQPIPAELNDYLNEEYLVNAIFLYNKETCGSCVHELYEYQKIIDEYYDDIVGFKIYLGDSSESLIETIDYWLGSKQEYFISSSKEVDTFLSDYNGFKVVPQLLFIWNEYVIHRVAIETNNVTPFEDKLALLQLIINPKQYTYENINP